MTNWTPMVDVIPAGKSGNAEIRHVRVTEHDAMMSALRGQHLNVGPLCQLLVDGQLVMSDGPEEHRSNTYAVQRAHGDVLVAGLGIGMILVPIVQKAEVRTVTVLESNPHVIRLVEEPLRDYLGWQHAPKLNVVQADVRTWRWSPGAAWDTIYFDIWEDICTDHLPEMTKLKRRYAKRRRSTNPQSWMGAWSEAELRRRQQLDSRRYSVWR